MSESTFSAVLGRRMAFAKRFNMPSLVNTCRFLRNSRARSGSLQIQEYRAGFCNFLCENRERQSGQVFLAFARVQDGGAL